MSKLRTLTLLVCLSVLWCTGCGGAGGGRSFVGDGWSRGDGELDVARSDDANNTTVDATSGGDSGGSTPDGTIAVDAFDSDGGRREVCDNGLDDDGDGTVDETCPCVPGSSQRCFPGPAGRAGIGMCAFGMQRCMGSGSEFGTWGSCEGAVLPSGERCDGRDNDCDGRVDNGCECRPGDARDCYTGPMGTRGIGACRDGRQTCVSGPGGEGSTWEACTGQITPGREVCDGIDNDCNGTVDDGCACTPGATRRCYGGPIGTEGVGPCRAGTQTCVVTGGTPTWGPCQMQVLPTGEVCDRIDNDCDGVVDDGCECRIGESRVCYTGPMGTRGVGLCADGVQTCVAGPGGIGSTWGPCTGEQLPTAEICDDRDNNCNGAIDDGCACRRGESRSCYTGPAGTVGVGVCRSGTQGCVVESGVARWDRCVGEVLPGTEVCNDIDDDCDGMVDDGCACRMGETRTCYTGPAGTAGVGICAWGVQSCVVSGGMASWGPCSGDVTPRGETCDGIDDDCNGVADNGCACVPGSTRSCYPGPAGTAGVGICREGTQRCETGAGGVGSAWGPCSGYVLPAAESCNSIDDDCDGMIDDGCTCIGGTSRSCYGGPPGTAGVGVCRTGTQSCVVSGGVASWSDCSGDVTPSAEVCDGLDNDCDGTVDDGCACVPGSVRTCYSGPAGTEGVGVCRAGTQTCNAGPGGVGSSWGSCMDEVLPGPEVCDGADSDCDGTVDDGCACVPGSVRTCYSGPAGTEGVGVCRAGTQTCNAGPGGVGSSWGSCMGEVLPSTETCNMVDDNCNGSIDDGLSCSGPTVTCPAPVTAPAGSTVTLTAMATGASSYRWEVISSPPGSSYTLGSPTTATTTFSSVIVGTYTLQVTVTDAMGRTASCTTTVTMQAHGLRVELSWDTANDIDLHLHNAMATAWFMAPNDCYYANRNPAWDSPSTSDDPQLDVDDIDGFGPENIRIDSPVLSQTYTVGVHYYSGTPRSNVTVRIYCGDALAAPAFTRTLSPGPTSDRNDFWRVARVQFTSPSTCTVTPIDDVITTAAARSGSP